MRQRLAETRAQGYAISRGELDPDVLGIAGPVRGDGDRVVAGISVAALATRIPPERVDQVVDEVRRAAAEISHRLQLLNA